MNGTALAIRETSALAMWSHEQIEVIKDLICPGASDNELELFGQVCRRTGLDPFARQIYGLMRWDGRAKKNKLSIQTSVDGFRLTAERTGKYAGQLGPQWCGPDGIWRDVWLESDFPSAARVGVLRSDWKEPMWSVARWDSYVQKFRNKDSGGEFVGDMWKRMPDVMIAKCAESLGLRRAFPAELSGLYTAEEMAQSGGHEPPTIEDLPQFQNALVVESRSAPATRTDESIDWPEDPPAPQRCNKQGFTVAWHTAVKRTRFDDDETRHKFIAYHTQGKYDSLSKFLDDATHEQADGLIRAIAAYIKREAQERPPVVPAEVGLEPAS